MQENGDSSEPHSRTRTPSPERQSRPSKRRKIRHKLPHGLQFPDGKSQPRFHRKSFSEVTFSTVVTKNIITENEARELFKMSDFLGTVLIHTHSIFYLQVSMMVALPFCEC
jgi:hypothetical protein